MAKTRADNERRTTIAIDRDAYEVIDRVSRTSGIPRVKVVSWMSRLFVAATERQRLDAMKVPGERAVPRSRSKRG